MKTYSIRRISRFEIASQLQGGAAVLQISTCGLFKLRTKKPARRVGLFGAANIFHKHAALLWAGLRAVAVFARRLAPLNVKRIAWPSVTQNGRAQRNEENTKFIPVAGGKLAGKE